MDLVRATVCVIASSLSLTAFADPPCSMDRWEPFISEASNRFSVEPEWLRAVMQAESAGCEFMNGQPTRSSAGAMGLMQLMPTTWEQERHRLSLGHNPYDPRDNILAGAAYLRELRDRYGIRGFVAAYHAGPERYEALLAEGRALPQVTIEYLAHVRRNLEASSNGTRTQPFAKPSSSRSLFVTLRHETNDNAATDESTSDVQSIGRSP